MNKQLRDDLNNIMDCFTGADGGIAFVKLRQMLTMLDNQAQAGDTAAAEVLQTVTRFSKLVTLAEKL